LAGGVGTVFDGVAVAGGAGWVVVAVFEGVAIEEEVSIARVSTAFSVFTEQAARVQSSANAPKDDLVMDCWEEKWNGKLSAKR